MHFVYLIRSAKDQSKTYIGYTTHLKQRFETHNSGGSIHTKNDRPWKLVAYMAFDTEQKAREFEKYLNKSMVINCEHIYISNFNKKTVMQDLHSNFKQ